MKPVLFRCSLAALAASSLLVACDGDSKSNSPKLFCEFTVSQGAVPLGTQCLDAEVSAEFKVTNTGSAPCELALEVGGTAPQFFSISTSRLTIPVGGEAPVTATFKPTAEGGAELAKHYLGKVLISDIEGEQTEEVSIDGQTAATETKGILSIACPSTVKSCSAPDYERGEPCCRVIDLGGPDAGVWPDYGRTYLTSVEFGETQPNRTVTIPLEVSNLGCGTLEVSDLQINPGTGNTCGDTAMVVATQLPVSMAGSVSAQTRQKATIELQFTPSEPCDFGGTAVIVSNDPDIKDDDPITRMFGTFLLMASGVQGHLTSYPGTGDFGDVGVGEAKEKTFEIENLGGRAVEVSSLKIRNASAHFSVAKAERVDCTTQESTEIPAGTRFTLAPTDHASGCGDDHVNVTVRFSPNDAGNFEDWLEVDYGVGALSVKLTGQSRPDLVVHPDSTIWFYGPSGLGCEPKTCTIGDLPNATCSSLCASDADCSGGNPCVDGVCAANSAGACIETCSWAERTIRLCNQGHAPLRFDSADAGGGLVITDGSDPTLPGPKHAPNANFPDPTRDDQPMFSIVANGCADASGNGITLARNTKDENGQVVSMECCDVTIRYLDTRNGGSVAGVNSAGLHVYTNDPSYPRDGYGLLVSIMARSDFDADPIADFAAYDQVAGPGNPPKMGKMAVLDASNSRDPACRAGETNCTQFNPVTSYQWELVSIGNRNDEYARAMKGPIDLDDPNKNCPNWINDGNCYEVVDLGAQRGKVIRFYPDNLEEGAYTFRLTVTDGVCDPPHRGVTTNTITINTAD